MFSAVKRCKRIGATRPRPVARTAAKMRLGRVDAMKADCYRKAAENSVKSVVT